MDLAEPLWDAFLLEALPIEELLPLAGVLTEVELWMPIGPSSFDCLASGNTPVETTARFIDFSSVRDNLSLPEDLPLRREIRDVDGECSSVELDVLFEARVLAAVELVAVVLSLMAVSADNCRPFLFLSAISM